MRKVVLYIALSLDGYIADSSGGIDWLNGQDETYKGDYGYSEFAASIDTVVMGYTTYYQLVTELSPDSWPNTGMISYVLTHRDIADTHEIKFVNQSATELLASLKKQEGKSIWICGGANMVAPFIEHDLIDEYHLSIMPVLLGKGIRLFGEQANRVELRLISMTSVNGVVECIYHRR